MDSPFRLLVYAVVTAALLYLAISLLSPYTETKIDVTEEFNEGISQALLNEGKIVVKTYEIPENTNLISDNFRTTSREINFYCNNPVYCCSKDSKCEKDIEWNSAKIVFKKDFRQEISFRCEKHTSIVGCVIYVGTKPPQIELVGLENKIKLDFSIQKRIDVAFKVKNSGSLAVYSNPKIEIKIKTINDELLLEQKLELDSIQPFSEQGRIFSIDSMAFPSNEKYYLEIFASSTDGGYERREIELDVKGLGTISCETQGEPSDFYLEGNECVQKLPCSNCLLASQCSSAWMQKGFNARLYSPDYALNPGKPEYCE